MGRPFGNAALTVKMFFEVVKKGLVKTDKMLYNVSNIYYTTLFWIFQEELALFL